MNSQSAILNVTISRRYRNIKPVIVDAVQADGPAEIRLRGTVLRAGSGDWLVLDTQGNLYVFHDLFFRRSFAPLNGSKPVDGFRERLACGGC